jgi:aminopeptidase N
MNRISLLIGLVALAILPTSGVGSAQTEPPDSAGHIEAIHKQLLCPRMPGRAANARDYDWDILNAELYLYPNFDTETLWGSVLFSCRSEVEGLAELVLDFRDNMDVSFLHVDGNAAAYTRANDQITVSVSPPASLGQLFTVGADFSGTPEATGFGSFRWDLHEEVPIVWTLSEPEGARDWWPCKDVPDEKFTADLYYRVPSDFLAPGPGLLQGVNDAGDGTAIWHWREDYPINSYLIALTSTNYEHYTDWYVDAAGDSLPIENYVFPENLANSVEDLSVTPEAMALLDSVFGPYPFMGEKYGHMVFKWGGAMEHQTCTSFGSFLLQGEHRYDRIVVHELAHQWFGDSVTLQDWENVWLNEGFASYAEALWFELQGGQDGLTYWMTQTTAYPDFDGPVYNNPVPFSSTVYRKGAWVLHMLRFIMGDEVFFGALRDYYERHAYANAHTEDLIDDLEAYTGLDLRVFFDQWVYGLYRPVYEWAWRKVGEPGDWYVQIQIRQTQSNTGLFVMPLPFRVWTATSVIDLRVDNDQWYQVYAIPLGNNEPLTVGFDPENWVLENSWEVPFDPTAVDRPPAAITALTGNWPNPFNPRTRIEFSLAAPSRARLDILDIQGRRVRTLVDGPRETGPQGAVWDGLDDHGRSLPSGVYLARLAAGGQVFSRRMTLLK